MTQQSSLTVRLAHLIAEVSALKSDLVALRSEHGKLADEVSALRSLLAKRDLGPARMRSLTSAAAFACSADALLKGKPPTRPKEEFFVCQDAPDPKTVDAQDPARLPQENPASSGDDADRTDASDTKITAPDPQGKSDVAVMEGANTPDTLPDDQEKAGTARVETEPATAQTTRATALPPEDIDDAAITDLAPASSTQESAPAALKRTKPKRTCRRNSKSKPALSAENLSEFIPSAERLVDNGLARDVEDALLLLLQSGVKCFETFIAAQETMESSENGSLA